MWSLSQACDIVLNLPNGHHNNLTTEVQECWYVYPDPKKTEWGGWSKFQPSFIHIQRLMLLFLVIHYGNCFELKLL